MLFIYRRTWRADASPARAMFSPGSLTRSYRSALSINLISISGITKTHGLTFMVSIIAGPATAGIYFIFLRLAEIISSLGAVSNDLLLAQLPRALTPEAREESFCAVQRFSFPLALLAAGGLTLFTPCFLKFWLKFDPPSWESWRFTRSALRPFNCLQIHRVQRRGRPLNRKARRHRGCYRRGCRGGNSLRSCKRITELPEPWSVQQFPCSRLSRPQDSLPDPVAPMRGVYGYAPGLRLARGANSPNISHPTSDILYTVKLPQQNPVSQWGPPPRNGLFISTRSIYPFIIEDVSSDGEREAFEQRVTERAQDCSDDTCIAQLRSVQHFHRAEYEHISQGLHSIARSHSVSHDHMQVVANREVCGVVQHDGRLEEKVLEQYILRHLGNC